MMTYDATCDVAFDHIVYMVRRQCHRNGKAPPKLFFCSHMDYDRAVEQQRVTGLHGAQYLKVPTSKPDEFLNALKLENDCALVGTDAVLPGEMYAFSSDGKLPLDYVGCLNGMVRITLPLDTK